MDKLGQLTKIAIKGFKSIKECDVDLRSINVLIGANGAGKSNFMCVFELIQSVLGRGLNYYAGKKGTETLFYNGKKETNTIVVELNFEENDLYSFAIEWTENNSFIFHNERFSIDGTELVDDVGHNQSNVLNVLRRWTNESGTKILNIMLNPGWIVYRFQDTTSSSRIKSEHNVSNCAAFFSDGRNLAAFLYRLKRHFPKEYADILSAVQLVAPYFSDFVLEPNELNEELIFLRWQQKESGDIFYASQLSDGTLRFICLATLLLQPALLQMSVIIIDEPELGLHPFAIAIFAELVKKASVNKQIILSTQSVELLNNFSAEDIIVVDKHENGSKFRRLELDKLTEWLEDDYTLGELWNKNILGGRFAQ
ncbi:MAG: AAA family ATPase [Lachnospiraceae bacterium]|nr:AAA family ATPase [Lachnospiraceae bacterium]